MDIKIAPSKAVGEITAPPSKSLAHRALIFGALSEKSVIKNVAFSKDIEATLNCLKSLGASVLVNENTVTVGGLDFKNIPENAKLPCFESGSTLRFFLPLCMAAGKKITLFGAKRLFERPLTVYSEIAKEQGIEFLKTEDSVTVCGNLKSGEYSVAGNISSQFITGLLIALPLLSGNSRLEVTGKFESESYIDLTLQTMEEYGIIINRNGNVFEIKGNQKPKNSELTVEGDCSNAAFLEAFNYLGGNVAVKGLNQNTLQGDRVYKDIFPGLKNGVKEFDLSDCPDLAPVCFAVAAALDGGVFTGTARLKIKESDRATAMQTELSKFGINVFVEENRVIVENGILRKPDKVLNSHNDHRIAMALSLLCTLKGGTVAGAEAVSKSYPDFFSKIQSLGIDVNEVN
ncbi:MAG: 3-phosphoshikimate 1-carboxyvinyltransferase [Acutalibacteraceae bacterium]|nr:3-phosphoshikimate 1-carboxyvinyltransferase [Acutalibacteraceae bacterium]